MSSMVECVAVLRELAGEDLGGLPDGAQLGRVEDWEEIVRVAQAGLAEAVGAVHRRGAVAYNGAPSTKAWLQGSLKMTSGEASALVDTARRLPVLPRFAAALSAGVVSFGHVKVAAWLARKVDAVDPDLVPVAEEMLFENAHRLSCSELRQIAKRILEHLLPAKEHPPEPERAVYLGQTYDDIWDLKGSLSPECGAMLQTYFATLPKPDPEDMRSAAERRHDALRDLIRHILDTGELPTTAGEQPHLTVLVHASDLRRTPAGRTVLADTPVSAPGAPLSEILVRPDDEWSLDADGEQEWVTDWDWDVVADWLADPQHQPEPAAPTRHYPDSGPGGPDTRPGGSGRGPRVWVPGSRWVPGPGDGGRTDFGDTLPLEAIDRIACDAAINRIVLGPDDVPIAVGRRSRLVPPTMRRGLVVRDQGCRFHYCTRPPHWTQAHHIIPWSHGGPTDMNNLILLCGFHHHRVHDEGWTLEFDGRELTIRRPDGTILDPPD
ncbi:HNH endonuclease [Cryptosporangium aurantiacum]|nr:HNH endonuclease signature motif containing protein [Cryptosporangium aurantiacum]